MDPLGQRFRGLLDGRLPLLPRLDDFRADALLGPSDPLDLSGQLPHPGTQLFQARLEAGQDRLSQALARSSVEGDPQDDNAREEQEAKDTEENQKLALRHV
jgi:hypothetical protein